MFTLAESIKYESQFSLFTSGDKVRLKPPQTKLFYPVHNYFFSGLVESATTDAVSVIWHHSSYRAREIRSLDLEHIPSLSDPKHHLIEVIKAIAKIRGGSAMLLLPEYLQIESARKCTSLFNTLVYRTPAIYGPCGRIKSITGASNSLSLSYYNQPDLSWTIADSFPLLVGHL